jgi:hypothetical protein
VNHQPLDGLLLFATDQYGLRGCVEGQAADQTPAPMGGSDEQVHSPEAVGNSGDWCMGLMDDLNIHFTQISDTGANIPAECDKLHETRGGLPGLLPPFLQILQASFPQHLSHRRLPN